MYSAPKAVELAEDNQRMELQHVNVKLLLKDSAGLDLEALIPIFHRWIQDKVFEDLLLDIADYRHVHDGPGVVLIGHQGDYAVDNTGGRLGVRYNRKAALAGSNRDRLQQALQAALNACRLLENETSLNGKFRFDGQNIELFINDRMLAPNTEATRGAVEPELRAFVDPLFAPVEYSLSFDDDPRRRFSAALHADRPFSVAELQTALQRQ
jgi:hypothetical protein